MDISRTYSDTILLLRQKAEELFQNTGEELALPLAIDITDLLHDLHAYHEELILRNSQLLASQNEHAGTEDQCLDLFDQDPVGYVVYNDQAMVLQANRTAATLLATRRRHLLNESFRRYVIRRHHDTFTNHLNAAAETGETQSIEIELLKNDGSIFLAALETSPSRVTSEYDRLYRTVFSDASSCKASLGSLQRANVGLERLVRSQNKELAKLQGAFQKEMESNKQLNEKVDKLIAENDLKKTQLRESQTAIRVMANRSTEDKRELESNTIHEVHKLLLPYLNGILRTQLTHSQRKMIELIISRLNQVTSSFARQLGSESLGLSAREIQIANMIREGLSSKEIADIICISTETVGFHRRSIRSKLGIKNTKTNLSTKLNDFL